jgi:hypothetical protein
MYITLQLGKMRQDLAAAHHLLSSAFFGKKFIEDYGFGWRATSNSYLHNSFILGPISRPYGVLCAEIRLHGCKNNPSSQLVRSFLVLKFRREKPRPSLPSTFKLRGPVNDHLSAFLQCLQIFFSRHSKLRRFKWYGVFQIKSPTFP